MEICYNHRFMYAEFEIINIFLKERRSKWKPAYAINTLHFLNCSCLYRDFSLVVEIWFKVGLQQQIDMRIKRHIVYILCKLAFEYKKCAFFFLIITFLGLEIAI